MMRNSPEFHVPRHGRAHVCGATAGVDLQLVVARADRSTWPGTARPSSAIVEDTGFLERFLKVRDELPDLEHLGMLSDPDGAGRAATSSPATSCSAPTRSTSPAAAAVCTPDDLATIIYTSGTTGPPKGVMLSHYNVVLDRREPARELLDFDDFAGKRLVSYLPMAHIAERMTSHYQQAFVGYEVTAAPTPARSPPTPGR